jgi:4-amino-4-deoxy-L-arabinose transferase-like glycosyltransferase
MKGKVIWVILILAFVLRFVSVTKFPVGFNADEASFGYDAYSILQTGRDQWGNVMPLVLKSFGDYKSPLYSYISMPFVAIFGLNILAVRLPNVIIGTLAVLAVYLLVKEIFKSKKWLGIFAALFLAVNPWSVMMSRGAFEANLITFFLPMGIYFFLKGLENRKYLVWSAIFFGFNLFTYHSAKLITPIVVVGLIIVFWKKISVVGIKKTILSGIIFFVFAILTAYTFFIGGGSRISERSITQGALEEGAKQKIELIASGTNPFLAKALHNKYQVVIQRFVTNYFQYFSPKFLFTRGSSDSYYGMFPGIGVIYLFDGLMLLGLVPYLLNKNPKKTLLMVLAWLLIAPLPAALSTGAGFAGNRAIGMLPVIQIVEIFGLVGWISLLKKPFSKIIYIVMTVLGIFLIWNVANFLRTYIKKIPQSAYEQMCDGSLEAANWLSQNRNGKNVIVSRSFGEPQIFFAFANIWSPFDYQMSTKNWDLEKTHTLWLDQLSEYSLGDYTIKSVDWKTDILKEDTLIVSRSNEVPEEILPLHVINYKNGTPSLFIVDMNQKNYAKAN